MTLTFKQAFDSNQVFIIAEIGINHNGNIEIAKQLMDLINNNLAVDKEISINRFDKLIIHQN